MVSTILGGVETVLDKFIVDANVREQAKNEILRMEYEAAKGQMAVNQAEAQHKSVFVAGWRASAGWVCVSGLAVMFLIKPILVFGLAIAGTDPVVMEQVVSFRLEMGELMTVLGGMLGLVGARSYDKKKGTATNSIKNKITDAVLSRIGGNK